MSGQSAGHVGIDFGTTNTAVAVALPGPGGGVQLARLPGPGGVPADTWRTVLFFEEGAPPCAGAPAIDRFAEREGDGRLVQSIKSHLASAAFTRTMIFGRTYTLEALVGAYLRALRAAVGADLGARAVVGRPVRYWGARTEADEERALGRMRAALALAGFTEVVFEYEPIAAAVRYAATLDRPELIVVADFGGGTSDFSLVRVGPGTARGESGPEAVLATSGLAIGGDSFDARIIDQRVVGALGRGTSYRDEMGARTPIPDALFRKLRRWHHLSFLKEPATVRLLERMQQGAEAPEKVNRLVRLVRDELGLPLHRAVERTKVSLSGRADTRLAFPDLDLDLPVTRPELEDWIGEELEAIDGAITTLLERAGVGAADVDTVFATGGSSLVPVVRSRLSARFGQAKLASGDELTSVAWGLAARARQLFG
jgi:hypothetical chaperone protein